jgi:hypothetical protein
MEKDESSSHKKAPKAMRKARFICRPCYVMQPMMIQEPTFNFACEQPTQSIPRPPTTNTMKYSQSTPNFIPNLVIEDKLPKKSNNPPGSFDIISRGNLPSISFIRGSIVVEPSRKLEENQTTSE